MSKRRGSAASTLLTGGSGDVKPQILSIPRQTPNVDTSFQATIVTPVPRISPSSNKATIMEVLKVYFYLLNQDSTSQAWCYLATAPIEPGGTTLITFPTGSISMSDSRVFAAVSRTESITTSGGLSEFLPIVVDLTDGAGNGVLVATDNIFFEGSSDNSALGMVFFAKVLYRTFDAGILEYVGIVQSQQ